MNRTKNIMTFGVELTAPTPQPEKYFNDLIHPSVKYIPGGFAGHDWWMVATPYYNYNSAIENPILYYGDSREGGLPPLVWNPTAIVQDTPSTGYNSDGCIYFDGSKLWVFWRENGTPDTDNTGGRATFGVSTINGTTFSTKKLFAPLGFSIQGKTGDAEMCPIITDIRGKIELFGCHYEFEPKRQPYGLAIWDIENNDLENKTFTLTKTVGQLYYGGFNFWHFDVFKYEDKYYCLVTPESGNEILLGTSNDGENFKYWSTPLISSLKTGRSYLYKPCGMVLNDVFYLWYPSKNASGVNKLYMSQMNFKKLLLDIDKTINIIS